MHNFEHLLSRTEKGSYVPVFMGILNVTPDSFSDGNKYNTLSTAVLKAFDYIAQGAGILDIGGESTRPGSSEVSLEVEADRVIPVIREIRKSSGIPISIDTRKAQVAELAILAGANLVNDISSLRHDAEMAAVLAKYPEVGLILMHMQGEPSTMQRNPVYANVIEDILKFFVERIAFCEQHGINRDRLYLDPGIGFGKTLEHNLTIISGIQAFKSLNLPIVFGASRKSFINQIDASEPQCRIGGSLAATTAAMQASIDIIRVHDLKEHMQFYKVTKALEQVKQA